MYAAFSTRQIIDRNELENEMNRDSSKVNEAGNSQNTQLYKAGKIEKRASQPNIKELDTSSGKSVEVNNLTSEIK